jgi:TPR repeat protein
VRAEAGDAEAQFDLGFMYYEGEGVPEDHAEAVRWYRLAADQGLAEAQFNLGLMYGNGEGVPQDDVQAHMWLNLVASRSTGEDRESAVSARDRVRARMTAEQVAEAQRLAREWNAAHPREPRNYLLEKFEEELLDALAVPR